MIKNIEKSQTISTNFCEMNNPLDEKDFLSHILRISDCIAFIGCVLGDYEC